MLAGLGEMMPGRLGCRAVEGLAGPVGLRGIPARGAGRARRAARYSGEGGWSVSVS